MLSELNLSMYSGLTVTPTKRIFKIANTVLSGNKVGELTLLSFKNYYRVTVIKTPLWFLQKDTPTDQSEQDKKPGNTLINTVTGL